MYWNDEYEPQLVRRHDAVASTLRRAAIAVRRFHDRLLVAPGTVAGGPKAANQRPSTSLSRRLARYDAGRDRPADDATARLSAELRFGTLSPRTVTSAMLAAAQEARRLRSGAE